MRNVRDRRSMWRSRNWGWAAFTRAAPAWWRLTTPAFVLARGRGPIVSGAWTELAPLYWGTRVPVGDAAASIRTWIAENIHG